ncbi:MAG: MaoC/PaaZ C-terminal domain-containing protein [Lachnospiraceae bacterium]|nr:MaoC/PaaZ C-terminal domain-containing protein [Lachnospiraceae bacterium]
MLKAGDTYTSVRIASDETVKKIAEVSGDTNPIHIDEKYASGSMFGKRIAHGLFCINSISEAIGNHLPGNGAVLLSQDFVYRKPVYIGDMIETIIKIEEIQKEKNIYVLSTVCKNETGETVLEGMSKVKYNIQKNLRLSRFIDVISGTLIKDGEFETLEYCTSDCKINFLTFIEKPEFFEKTSPNVSCIITTNENLNMIPKFVKGVAVVKEPKKAFVILHNYMAEKGIYRHTDFDTVIGRDCYISPSACISEKNVVIGDNVFIGANTVINGNVTIKNNSIIHENCVIGGKSFNFTRTKDGKMLGMKDMGQVVIDERAEVCPMCHIASCPLPTDITYLGKEVKLDAMVHIGHGTHIGARTEIPAGAQIAGNCKIGEEVWIGVNATVANRINIGDSGRVSLGAVVTRDVEKGKTVTGNFAVEHDRFINELKEANLKAAGISKGQALGKDLICKNCGKEYCLSDNLLKQI